MRGDALLGMMILAALALLPRTAVADSWYGSLDLGHSGFSGLTGGHGPFGGPFQPSSASTGYSLSDSSSAWRLALGYQFNPNFALEAGYVYLGKAEQTGTVVVNPNPFNPQVQAVDETVKAYGYVVEAAGSLPLGETWSLFGRAGEIANRTENNFGSGAYTGSSGHITYGVGIDWLYSQSLRFRLSWDAYDSLGDHNTTGTYGVDVVELGLLYSFQ